jgi:hypothetical protein
METIRELLTKLNNQVPPSMAKRLDGLQSLQEKLRVAKEEFQEAQTEENEEALEDIKEYIADQTEDVIEDLKVLVRRKKFADEEQKASENTPKTDEASKSNEEPKGDEKPKDEEKKEKSGLGVFGMVFGGVLLVASLGAINYFRNNR